MLVDHLDIPVTAKIRLGWDDQTLNYLEISRIIEDAGCGAVAVHARTRSQGYKGNANWEAIAEIKKSVSIPVIGNGDIRTPLDIKSMFSQTGCDAVMIGRAALSNPWIFSGLDRNEVNPELVQKGIDLLLDLMQDFYGLERGLVLSRKFISRFIAPYKIRSDVRREILTTIDRKTLQDLFSAIFSDTQTDSIERN